jgi:hypothetical protein
LVFFRLQAFSGNFFGEKGAEEMLDMNTLQWATVPYFIGI